MHFYVSGGSGRNGQLIIQEALSKGHTVTALVRNPDNLSATLSHANLTLVKGTPTSQSDVERALATPSTPDIIISALAMRRTSGSPFAPLAEGTTTAFLSDTTDTLLKAVSNVFNTSTTSTTKKSSQASLPKIIVNSAVGVGPSLKNTWMPLRWIFRHSTMRFEIADHELADNMVRDSGLRFVIARPPVLLEGEAKPMRVWPEDGQGMSWLATATRESVASWMVEAAEKNEWDGTAPVITN